jgi:hypothetical protein
MKANTAGDVVHRVEHIFCKHEALSSNPQANKFKKMREIWKQRMKKQVEYN